MLVNRIEMEAPIYSTRTGTRADVGSPACAELFRPTRLIYAQLFDPYEQRDGRLGRAGPKVAQQIYIYTVCCSYRFLKLSLLCYHIMTDYECRPKHWNSLGTRLFETELSVSENAGNTLARMLVTYARNVRP